MDYPLSSRLKKIFSLLFNHITVSFTVKCPRVEDIVVILHDSEIRGIFNSVTKTLQWVDRFHGKPERFHLFFFDRHVVWDTQLTDASKTKLWSRLNIN